MHDARSLIAQIHGATIEAEFDRVTTQVQTRFLNDPTPTEILSVYKLELVLAKSLIAQWKRDFPKGSRPPQYQAKKELVALLEQEITFWQSKMQPSAPIVKSALTVAIKPKKTAKRSERQAKEVIQRGLTLEDVTMIFEDIRPFVQGKGGWATAIAALHSQGYLVGSADTLAAWFKEGKFGGETSDRTISNCIRDHKEEVEFSKDRQRIIDSVLKWADTKAKR